MKVEHFEPPKSSFLSIDKDMNTIVTQICKNDRLKKLLYYTTADALDKPALTEEQTMSLFGKNIKNVPKLTVDGSVLNYILINFDNFTANATNPKYRDNVIEFDIICHFDQWNLKDFQLRPYKIAAELDVLFNNRHLSGIGTLQFMGATQMVLTDEFAGICLMYEAIHGGEDEVHAPTEQMDKDLIENFEKIFDE